MNNSYDYSKSRDETRKSEKSTRLAYLCRHYADGRTLHIPRLFTRFLDTRCTLIYFHCSASETHCQDERVRCIGFPLMLWDLDLVRAGCVRYIEFLLMQWDGVFLTNAIRRVFKTRVQNR